MKLYVQQEACPSGFRNYRKSLESFQDWYCQLASKA